MKPQASKPVFMTQNSNLSNGPTSQINVGGTSALSPTTGSSGATFQKHSPFPIVEQKEPVITPSRATPQQSSVEITQPSEDPVIKEETPQIPQTEEQQEEVKVAPEQKSPIKIPKLDNNFMKSPEPTLASTRAGSTVDYMNESTYNITDPDIIPPAMSTEASEPSELPQEDAQFTDAPTEGERLHQAIEVMDDEGIQMLKYKLESFLDLYSSNPKGQKAALNTLKSMFRNIINAKDQAQQTFNF